MPGLYAQLAGLGGVDDAQLAGALAGQRDARVGGDRGGGGHAGHDLEPDPGLGARRGVGGRAAEQQRVAGEEPDRQLARLRRLHQRAGSGRRLRRVDQGGVPAQVTPRHRGQAVAPATTRLGLAEQLGRPHGQQPLVARPAADQRDPAHDS